MGYVWGGGGHTKRNPPFFAAGSLYTVSEESARVIPGARSVLG